MAKKKKEVEEQPADTSDGTVAVNDAWTGMLVVSLFALLIGAGFLAWDYWQYSDQDPPKVPKLTTTPPAAIKKEQPKEEPPAKDGAAKDGGMKDAGK